MYVKTRFCGIRVLSFHSWGFMVVKVSTPAKKSTSTRRKTVTGMGKCEQSAKPALRRAVSYLRFSTPEQAKGSSEARQMALTLEHCKNEGLELFEKFHDRGRSAYRGNHRKKGRFGDFMRAVEEGTFPRGTVLIVESFDRLSREQVTVALQQFLTLINDHGIEIHVVADGRRPGIYTKENLDTHSLFLAIIEMSRAFGESERKGQLTSGAWDRLRSSGKPVGKNGGRPMGKHPSWLLWKRGQWEVMKERAAVVRRIFELAVKQRLGRYEIAVRLVAEQAPHWGTGSFWTASGVKRALDNPAVAGRLEPRRSKNPNARVIENYYPVLLPYDEYLEAQRVIRARASGGGRPRKIHQEALLTGITWARSCRVHRGFSQQRSGKHQLTYSYVHQNRNCYLSMGARLERMVLSAFGKMVDGDLSVSDANVKRKEITDSIRAFTALRTKAEAAIENFLDAIGGAEARQGRAMPELFARLSRAEADRDKYTSRILASENQRELLPSDGTDARRRLIELQERAHSGDEAARSEVRSLLHRMVLRIDVARRDWPSWIKTLPEIARKGAEIASVGGLKGGLVFIIQLRNGRFFYCSEGHYGSDVMMRMPDWSSMNPNSKHGLDEIVVTSSGSAP